MRATEKKKESPVTVDTITLMEMLHTGRPAAVKIGTEAGARVQIGRLVLWNVKKIQEYLDLISE